MESQLDYSGDCMELVYFIIFPGAIFTILMSFYCSWFLRKIVARMENRVGPPFMQPMFDFAKLLAKERIYPVNSEKWILHYMPMFQFCIALLMSLFIPITGKEGLISFDGDLYFFIFLLAMHGITTFFVGWASRNPYSVSGAGRAVMTEISLEIPLSLSLGGIAIISGTIRISELADNLKSAIISNSPISWIYIIPLFLFGVIIFYSSLGALEYSPFSAGHAETEIVSGWNTELTGSDLAFTKIADYINLFNLTGLAVIIFFGGTLVTNTGIVTLDVLIATIVFIIKITIATFFVAFVRTVSSRLRIDQITKSLWVYFFPSALITVLISFLTKSLIGGIS